MELLVNDLSLHKQFHDIDAFRAAIKRVMEIRSVAQRYGRALYCHRNIPAVWVTPEMTMPQAIQHLSRDEQRALMQWITRHGPFWEDDRRHRPDDYLECNDDIVTDKAVGEAGWCCLNDIERGLVSFIPSDWEFSPVAVRWVSEDITREVNVPNYRDPQTVEEVLQTTVPLPVTWSQLQESAVARFTELTFGADAFAPLNGHAFSASAAERILNILHQLNYFKSCFTSEGKLSEEGHRVYRDFFTGRKGGGGRGALFSDSSDSEKREFAKEMTFKRPGDGNETIFCPWHGKVQTPQFRVHFSWPVKADEALYVVYVGPKITKR